jgi:hypothetical protein
MPRGCLDRLVIAVLAWPDLDSRHIRASQQAIETAFATSAAPILMESAPAPSSTSRWQTPCDGGSRATPTAATQTGAAVSVRHRRVTAAMRTRRPPIDTPNLDVIEARLGMLADGRRVRLTLE